MFSSIPLVLRSPEATRLSIDLDAAMETMHNEQMELPLFPETKFPTGDVPQSVSVGDLDNDGVLDLVSANYFSRNVSVLLGAQDPGPRS